MNHDIPQMPAPPRPERELHWLSRDEILGKMNSFIDTRGGKAEKPPRIETRPDDLVTFVEYEIKNEDGSISVFAYRLVGPRSANTVINVAHFRGNPDDGNWLGGGGTLSNYDEKTGKWTDVKDVK